MNGSFWTFVEISTSSLSNQNNIHGAACLRYIVVRDHYLFISIDDKHKVKIGEPGYSVAMTYRVFELIHAGIHIHVYRYVEHNHIPSPESSNGRLGRV